ERPGAKFYKWELRGVPLRIEIGPRDIQNGVAILARRDGEKNSVPMNELVETILKEAEDLYQSIYNKAQNFMNERVKDCSTVEEAKKQIEMGIARVGWCGSEDCGYQLEEQVDASVLGEPWNSKTSFHGRCLVCGAETENCALMSRQY
ncbi:MAG: His/Gly/Thr/Pro-type tRNA ligase C-terminal domain-containing protein, partial [Alphaproteobacteria bacterium]|nr:His/Gly/Thr/Pro-type tRNA ligase C-terminal domain-containing protein [Alphaproteobacteria bacterium]